MHPLRIWLYTSLAIAFVAAVAFAEFLAGHGVTTRDAVILGVLVCIAFLTPWTGVYLWALRRAGDMDRLTDRTREIVEGRDVEPATDREYHGEVDDLARAVEQVRALLHEERAWAIEQRHTMESIAASLGEGLLAVDGDGRVVIANERLREMFGISHASIGRPFLEVVRMKSVAAAFDKTRAGEASRDRIVFDSGDVERQIEIRAFPVANSASVAAVALFIDVTQLERLQRIRKDFLEDFSHEVRTPLAGLRSAVETFEQRGLTELQERQLREVMLRQLGRIERLVKELSELNRIESGDLVLERRNVRVDEILREMSIEFQNRIGSRPAIRLEAQPAVAFADAARVQQIFTNLIDNAIKHGGGGEILIEAAQSGSDVVVRVSDEGDGIPPGEITRIFHRFYRVDKSRSQHVPGVGLGLAITKHLVLLHGGTVRAYNRPRRGATFEVRLPAAIANTAA
jgi:two-component system phosphate regulon sensor histidine kinase PhoR